MRLSSWPRSEKLTQKPTGDELNIANILILSSAALLVVTALVHSLVGEQKLLMPILSSRDGVLRHDLARWVLRFAWHITSLSWVVLAAILVIFVSKPDHALHWSLLLIGGAFTIAGIFDAFASRGRHIGWPMLTAIGLCALIAQAMRN